MVDSGEGRVGGGRTDDVFGANSLLITTPDQLRAGTLTTHDLAVWGHKSIYLPCGPPLSCAICWHEEGMKSKALSDTNGEILVRGRGVEAELDVAGGQWRIASQIDQAGLGSRSFIG